ncbi:MAG: hypothetical protein ABIO06_02510 [Pseudolysinimonas sp.]
MPRPGPLPEPLRASGFTIAEARRHGVTRARTRARNLETPFYGVRVKGATSDLRSRAVAYSAGMPPYQYFSHTTAAQLHGLRMPHGFRETELHVTSLAPSRAPRGVGVIGHGAESAEISVVSGLRMLSAIETWCQLSAQLSLDDLVVMGDGLVRRKKALATMAQLRDAVARYSGRGCRKLRQALELVRPGTDSARETTLRLIVLRAGFPEPEVNGVIVNSHGAEIAHGDLVFREYRTILEYEGRQHSENARQFTIDISRLDELMEERWRVIRVDADLLARRATLLAKVDTALHGGGWGSSIPSR